MSKRTLLALSVFALVCGIVWVSAYHLSGLAVVIVIGLPLLLGALSARFGL